MSTLEWIVVLGAGYWIYSQSKDTQAKAHLNPSRIQPGAAENMAQVSGFNYTDLVQQVQNYGVVDSGVAPGSTVGVIAQVVQSQLPAPSVTSSGRSITVTPGLSPVAIGPVRP